MSSVTSIQTGADSLNLFTCCREFAEELLHVVRQATDLSRGAGPARRAATLEHQASCLSLLAAEAARLAIEPSSVPAM